MVNYVDSEFYRLLQDFFITKDKNTFIEFLGEFYNRTEEIINKNETQDEIIKELYDLYKKFNENGIDENIIIEKVNYILENNVKVQNINTELKTIGVNFDVKYPRLTSETNDYNRFMRAYKDLKEGQTLLLSNKTYEFGGNSIILDKNVNIKGNKKAFYDLTNKTFVEKTGTILKNVKLVFKSRGYTVENISVQSENIDNAFEGNTGNCSDIVIRNCGAKCYSHCYLFESYNGYVNNVKIIDSVAYDSTHGFISKATNTQFINCYAYGMSQYGFGFISDNIPSADKKGNGSGGVSINCMAENCLKAICLYSRDMHSEDNSNSITLSKVNISQFTSKNCTTGFMFGDGLITTEGVTYNPIYNINCIGCRSEHSNNTQTSLEIKKVNRMSFEGYIDGKIVHNGFVVRDINLKIQSPYGNRDKLIDYDVINNNTDFPRLELKNMYENTIKIQNTQTTIIKGLLGGNFNLGDILTLIIDDNFTSIKNDSNLILKKALYSNKGTWIKLKYNGDKWEEIEHFENGATTQQIDLTSVSTITSSYTNTLDILIPNTTTNKIKLPNPSDVPYKEYTLFVRNNNGSGSTITYGGLDTTNLVTNTAIKTTLNAGEMQVINIVKTPFISKWLIQNVFDSKVF